VKSLAQENHTWISEERAMRSGVGGGAGGVIFGASGGDGRCERTLVFRDGRASSEDWSGDPEFCKRFSRRR
jgi:hypothetical protein